MKILSTTVFLFIVFFAGVSFCDDVINPIHQVTERDIHLEPATCPVLNAVDPVRVLLPSQYCGFSHEVTITWYWSEYDNEYKVKIDVSVTTYKVCEDPSISHDIVWTLWIYELCKVYTHGHSSFEGDPQTGIFEFELTIGAGVPPINGNLLTWSVYSMCINCVEYKQTNGSSQM